MASKKRTKLMAKSELKFSQLKIGLTIFTGMTIFAVLLFIIGTEANLFDKKYEIRLFTSDIQGLSEGAQVSLGGLKVGEVKSIEFSGLDNRNGLLIRLSLLEKYRHLIRTGSMAQIKTIGLLGDHYVNISMDNGNGRPLSNGEYLPLKEPVNIENTADKLISALDDMRTTLSNTKAITTDIRKGKGSLGRLIESHETIDRIDETLSGINKISIAVREGKGSLGKFINDPSMFNELKNTSGSLRGLAEDLKEGKGSFGKLLKDQSLYNGLSELSARLNEVAAKLNTGPGTASELLNDKELYVRLSESLKKFDSLVEDIKTNPKKYVRLSIF